MEDKKVDNNQWVMFAMFLFTVAKVTALICSTWIAAKVNPWLGAGLFIASILFRITWTYIPDKPKADTQSLDPANQR